eukprot:GHRR01021758.1.p1 GENE.GHRR01021758.1~~GHRR01021758.1.p1  ORF type:complete len:107 (+),score=14.01 GHRR01021758.1:19-339(+)
MLQVASCKADAHCSAHYSYLVHKVADMVWAKLLWAAYNLMQVCVHQIVHQVHILEVAGVCRRHNITQAHHIFMAQVREQCYLPAAHANDMGSACMCLLYAHLAGMS